MFQQPPKDVFLLDRDQNYLRLLVWCVEAGHPHAAYFLVGTQNSFFPYTPSKLWLYVRSEVMSAGILAPLVRQLQLQMGIVRLGDFLKKKFGEVIKARSAFDYRHQVMAVDASSTIYSFLAKTITYSHNRVNSPTDAHGNQTGHLIGLLYRVLLCKEAQLDTVWVFDGRAPQHKLDELYRRRQLKQEALSKTQAAKEAGDIQEAVRQSKRSIYISQTERQDAKKLLTLMGLPVIQAAAEGEAQCAWLAKNKYVQGVIGEDVDTLVFGAPFLLRNFNRGSSITQLSLNEIRSALGLTHEQFIDFCILCGCDYTAKIPMIGPVKALSLIKEHQSMEGVIEVLSSDEDYRRKHPIPDDFNHLIARRLFQRPTIRNCLPEQLERRPFQEQTLREFLMEKDFDEVRVDNWISKMKEFDSRAGHLL